MQHLLINSDSWYLAFYCLICLFSSRLVHYVSFSLSCIPISPFDFYHPPFSLYFHFPLLCPLTPVRPPPSSPSPCPSFFFLIYSQLLFYSCCLSSPACTTVAASKAIKQWEFSTQQMRWMDGRRMSGRGWGWAARRLDAWRREDNLHWSILCQKACQNNAFSKHPQSVFNSYWF